ncbi:MAG TPA: hypothetical protein DCF33_13125 [Saprospirales bacterium]|nr:hypothetical protein [Saprospirales bacterium]
MEPMFNANQDNPSVETTLEQNIPVVDQEAKIRQQRRQQRGLRWVLGGAALLVFSFGLNFVLYLAGADLAVPMYVLTSVGALSAIKGMVDIFGI